MPSLMPLLLADPLLPTEVRAAIARSPRDGARALMSLGLECWETAELLDLPKKPCDEEKPAGQ